MGTFLRCPYDKEYSKLGSIFQSSESIIPCAIPVSMSCPLFFSI